MRWLGPVALSVAILAVLVYDTLRAEDANKSATAAGTSSVMKIKDQSSSSTTEQSEKAASDAPAKAVWRYVNTDETQGRFEREQAESRKVHRRRCRQSNC